MCKLEQTEIKSLKIIILNWSKNSHQDKEKKILYQNTKQITPFFSSLSLTHQVNLKRKCENGKQDPSCRAEGIKNKTTHQAKKKLISICRFTRLNTDHLKIAGWSLTHTHTLHPAALCDHLLQLSPPECDFFL